MKELTFVRSGLCFRMFLLVFLLAIWSIPATAQEEERRAIIDAGDHLLTGFAGRQFSDDPFEGDEAESESEWNFGGSYLYHLTPHWGVEADVLFSPGKVDSEGADLEGADSDEEEDSDGEEGNDGMGEDDDGMSEDDGAVFDTLYFTGNVVYNFLPDRKLMPFVTAGAGLVRLDAERGGAQSQFAGVFGGGVLFALSKRLLVRVDIRDYIYSVDPTSLEASTPREGTNETANDLSLTGGVSFVF